MTILIIIALGFLGLGIGGLLNYLADVLPAYRSLVVPTCPVCNHKHSWIDYWLIKNCKNCTAKRPLRAWIVQFVTPILLVIVWFYTPEKLGFWISILIFTYFGLIAIIDIEHRLILHTTSIAGIIIMIPIGIIWNGWINTIMGGVAGFLMMFALYGLGILFNRLMARIRGEVVEEEALGFGDVNLSGVLGLLLGWPKIAISLFFAVMLAGIISGLMLLGKIITRKYQAFVPIPYAPFLIAAAVILIYMYR